MEWMDAGSIHPHIAACSFPVLLSRDGHDRLTLTHSAESSRGAAVTTTGGKQAIATLLIASVVHGDGGRKVTKRPVHDPRHGRWYVT